MRGDDEAQRFLLCLSRLRCNHRLLLIKNLLPVPDAWHGTLFLSVDSFPDRFGDYPVPCPVGMDRTVSEQAVVGKVSRPVTVDQEGFHPEEALVDVDDGKVPPGGHFGDDAVHFSYPMDGQRRGGEGIVQVEEEKGTRVPSAD